jgi:hypothetical protein
MSAPKEPAGRPARIKSVAVGGVSPLLAPQELALLAAYRAMDDETRQVAVEMLKNLARDFPSAPRLRLVAGGIA